MNFGVSVYPPVKDMKTQNALTVTITHKEFRAKSAYNLLEMVHFNEILYNINTGY